jgi:nucleotidyltransferase/DNA polymerase involved in DNA repair
VQQLIDAFGPGTGPYLLRLANFDDDREVEPVRLAKSESREITFDIDIHDPQELERVLVDLSIQLCERLVKQDQRGRNIGIKVRLDDFSTFTRATTIARATNDVETVTPIAVDLLRAFDAPRPVRLLGVRVAGLDEALDDSPQLALPL